MISERVSALRVICEFDPDDLPTGVGRRFHQAIKAARELGIEPQVAIVNDRARAGMSVPERARSALAFAADHTSRPAARTDLVIGLGSPTMLLVARKLARIGGSPVIFDTCDSTLLQLRARILSRRPGLVAVGLSMLLLQLTSSRRLQFSYISDRDARADRSFTRRRGIYVIDPSTDSKLAELAAFTFPLERFSVVAELNSFHNQPGFSMLVEAVRISGLTTAIDVYGPTAPSTDLPPPMIYRGWAKTLDEIYTGNTGVIATNIGGSGIPNKVLEANAARRPLVLHESVRSTSADSSPVWVFNDAATLSSALIDAASGVPRPDTTVRRKVATTHHYPRLNLAGGTTIR